MRIYDCFIFNNELDLLEMRLKYYWDDVDYFVLVESGTSFSKKEKPLHYEKNKERFKWAESKIRHIIHIPDVDSAGNVEDDKASYAHKTYRWNLEDQQREAILDGLHDAEDEDLIAIGDADEFYKLEVLRGFKADPFCAALIDHYYYLNGQREGKWGEDRQMLDYMPCTMLLKKKHLETSVSHIRNSMRWDGDRWPDAGWHFSYLGGAKNIIKKIEFFSHSEYDKPRFKDPKNMEEIIEKGGDILGRGEYSFKYVDIQKSNLYDDKIKSLMSEYPHLISPPKEQGENKICLNMIVKDESAIIESCLESVAPYLDYYVICDTGSSDDTKEKILKVMSKYDIVGEIHDIEFKNFEYSRNKALQLARTSDGDFNYILFDDADMILEVDKEDWKENLFHDYYLVPQYNEISYHNVRIVKKKAASKYVGVTHEYIDCAGEKGTLDEIRYHDLACGSSRKEKFERDARLLLEGVEKEKNESLITRYHFYLGQTYYDMGDYEKAIKHYDIRVRRGGWVEEVYYSMYRAGLAYERLGKEGDMLKAFVNAYNHHPARIEALYELSSYYRRREKYFSGYMFAKIACSMEFPKNDVLFIGKDIYDFKRWDELSICAFWAGRYKECKDVCKQLLDNDDVPTAHISRVKDNLKFAQEKCKI